MKIIKRLLPWYDPEEDELKSARADSAADKGRVVEARVRKLAESYHAEGLILRDIRIAKRQQP